MIILLPILSFPLHFLAVWGCCVFWMWPFMICTFHLFTFKLVNVKIFRSVYTRPKCLNYLFASTNIYDQTYARFIIIRGKRGHLLNNILDMNFIVYRYLLIFNPVSKLQKPYLCIPLIQQESPTNAYTCASDCKCNYRDATHSHCRSPGQCELVHFLLHSCPNDIILAVWLVNTIFVQFMILKPLIEKKSKIRENL